MLRELGIPRWVLLYGLIVPLAIFIGYLLATPLNFTSYFLVGNILLALSIPLLLRFHYPLLIFAWNSWVVIYFLPGQPSFGVVMAITSLFFSVLYRIMNKQSHFLHAPSVAIPVLFIGAVVFGTALLTGGLAGQALGSQLWGAKRYVGVFGAIIAYFALSAQRIPEDKARFYSSLFILSGLTAVMSDAIYFVGPSLYFLFVFFPTTVAYLQAVGQETIMRLTGICFGALAIYFWMLLRYTVRGIFDLSQPWRLAAFLLVTGLCMTGGYRAIVIVMLMVFLAQFYLEGLVRSKLFPLLLMSTALVGVFVVAFIDRMPLSVQRSLSFLPIEIDYMAKHDAFTSVDWRLQMWKTLLPDVPKYILLGKGFAFSGTDYYLTQEAIKHGYYSSFEDTLVSGNYHHGVLTVIIPFGIFGLIGLLWFGAAALRVLYRNHRYGREPLKTINTFLLAYFSARFLFYIGLYGQFDLDFGTFTGVVALSIALNAGIRAPEDVAIEAEERIEAEAEPAA